MSPTKKKGKNLSCGNKPEATSKVPWPWSELPPIPNLIHLPQRHFHSTIGPGTTKSWLTTSTRCKSTEHLDQQRRLCHLVSDDSSKNSSIWVSHNRYISDDLCIQTLPRHSNESYWCVLKVDSTGGSHPYPSAPLNSRTRLCSTLSSNLEERVLVYIRTCSNSIPSSSIMANYRICHKKYCYYYVCVRHECVTVDPFDTKKKYMEFTSKVLCEGKVYAMSLQGTLVVMQEVDLRLRIVAISNCRAVPSVSSRFFKEYLLESRGEIILVFLIHQKSLKIVDQVEVYRLCFADLEWIKVGSLHGRTMFIGQHCIWADSAEIGCKGDCVYFTQGSDNGWWIYDMKSGCILST